MPTFLRVIATRIRGFLGRDALDRDFGRELEAHLEIAEAEWIRRGLPPKEARRRARLELGGTTQLREAGREARGLPWLDTFWLDLKLGLRMLRKTWGLTLVGGLAMSTCIGLGALFFAYFEINLNNRLPLDEDDRVVALVTGTRDANRGAGISLGDVERWGEELGTVRNVGAFRTVSRNLGHAGEVAAVDVAEIHAAGFALARVPPLLGRVLVEDDELADAAPVIVIGWEPWQSRFGADPAILGRRIRLDGWEHTIVGVMPRGFGFPVNQAYWTALRAQPEDRFLGQADFGLVFARLAPSATLSEASAELGAAGLLLSEEPIEERGGRALPQPRALPYAAAFRSDFAPWEARAILTLVTLLLLPPCINIALLVYARTVSRQQEIAVRTALGASRGRIVAQLFLEVLVLALLAACVALVFVLAVAWWVRVALLDGSGRLPFWVDFGVPAQTVAFAIALAVLAAVIAGLVPALQATGRFSRFGLRWLDRRSGAQLGTLWTLLVVAQIGFCFAALPGATEMAWGTLRAHLLGPGFDADEYLTVSLRWNAASAGEAKPAATSRFTMLQERLLQRLEEESGLRTAATVATGLPGEAPYAQFRLEADAGSEGGSNTEATRFLGVDDAFFGVFPMTLLAGPGFAPDDFDARRAVVVVNQTFVDKNFGTVNPLGRRIRYVRQLGRRMAEAERERWYEIVGVVSDLPAHPFHGTVFHPASREQISPAHLALRVGGDSGPAAERLRALAAALDPALLVDDVRTLDEIYARQAVGNYLGGFGLLIGTLAVLLLSAAGIYALTSFTVNQRRREIGIRAALGAQPSRLIAAVFRRALGQVAAGAAVGFLAAAAIEHYFPLERLGAWNVPMILPIAATLLFCSTLLAAAGPARRVLRIDPNDELREG